MVLGTPKMNWQDGSHTPAVSHASTGASFSLEERGKMPNYRAYLIEWPTNTGVSFWVPTSSELHNPLQTCCARIYIVLLKPFFYASGQFAFGFAMISIITGIAMCILGFVGSSIRPFQIAGPLCISVGILVYIIGCLVSCGEFSYFQNALTQKALHDRTTHALNHLAKEDVIKWIQTEHETLEEFRQLSLVILNRRR